MSKSEQNSNYSKRKYMITSVEKARAITTEFLLSNEIDPKKLKLGLPEVDDRYHVWRVPLVKKDKASLGEIVIDAYSGEIERKKSSNVKVIIDRLNFDDTKPLKINKEKTLITKSPLQNSIFQGDSEENLALIPDGSVDLIFTSPPYFNARPDYSEYEIYDSYLKKMRSIIRECHRTLAEGRFFAINVSAVLVRRTSRSEASRRIPVPFDLNSIFIQEGFDFIDDIIWVKPEGAGWATGRGRRFAADRNPLQYKAVPVTEYVLVYRKHTDKLIDWNIRNHHDPDAVLDSKIDDGYEKTNIWKLHPSHSKDHPAVFPSELVERVIRYYSFKGDVVLDPFGGIGTLGKVAYKLGRRFVLSEMDSKYVEVMKNNLLKVMGKDAEDIVCHGCHPINSDGLF